MWVKKMWLGLRNGNDSKLWGRSTVGSCVDTTATCKSTAEFKVPQWQHWIVCAARGCAYSSALLPILFFIYVLYRYRFNFIFLNDYRKLVSFKYLLLLFMFFIVVVILYKFRMKLYHIAISQQMQIIQKNTIFAINEEKKCVYSFYSSWFCY